MDKYLKYLLAVSEAAADICGRPRAVAAASVGVPLYGTELVS